MRSTACLDTWGRRPWMTSSSSGVDFSTTSWAFGVILRVSPSFPGSSGVLISSPFVFFTFVFVINCLFCSRGIHLLMDFRLQSRIGMTWSRSSSSQHSAGCLHQGRIATLCVMARPRATMDSNIAVSESSRKSLSSRWRSLAARPWPRPALSGTMRSTKSGISEWNEIRLRSGLSQVGGEEGMSEFTPGRWSCHGPRTGF